MVRNGSKKSFWATWLWPVSASRFQGACFHNSGEFKLRRKSEEVIMVMIMPLEVKGSYRYLLNTNPFLPHPLQL